MGSHNRSSDPSTSTVERTIKRIVNAGLNSKELSLNQKYSCKWTILNIANQFQCPRSQLVFILNDIQLLYEDEASWAAFDPQMKVKVYSMQEICQKFVKNSQGKSILGLLLRFYDMVSDIRSCVLNCIGKESLEEILSADNCWHLLQTANLNASIFMEEYEYQAILNNKVKQQKESATVIIKEIEKINNIQALSANAFSELRSNVMLKLIGTEIDKRLVMKTKLDADVVATWTYKDGIKEGYNVYSNGDYPSYLINIEKSPGTSIMMNMKSDIVSKKFTKSELDKYMMSVNRTLAKNNLVPFTVTDKSMSYVQGSDYILDHRAAFNEAAAKIGVNASGIIMKLNSIHRVNTKIVVDPTLLVDMICTSNAFAEYDMSFAMSLDESMVPVSFKRFIKFKVRYGGIQFKIKVINNFLKQNNKSGCTILEITGVSNDVDINVMKMFCNLLIKLYLQERDKYRKIYYGPFEGIFCNAVTTNEMSKPKRPIGDARYCKNNGVEEPIVHRPDDETESAFAKRYKKQGYKITVLEGGVLEGGVLEGGVLKRIMVATRPDVIPVIAKNKKSRSNINGGIIIKGTKSGKRNVNATTKVLSNTGAVLSDTQRAKTSSMFFPYVRTHHVFRYGVERTTSSFLQCVLKALNITRDPSEYRRTEAMNFWVVKQEMSSYSIEQIESEFRNVNVTLDSAKYVRLFEVRYNINIAVLRLHSRGEITVEMKKYVNSHIWRPQNDGPYIVILRNYAVIEGSTYDPPYELLGWVNDNQNVEYLFHDTELTNIKYSNVNNMTIRSPIDVRHYDYQYIDASGKCILVGKKERMLVGTRNKRCIVWSSYVDRPLELEYRKIQDKELPTVANMLSRFNREKVSVDVIVHGGEDQIIGLWHSKVYYPTRMTPYREVSSGRCSVRSRDADEIPEENRDARGPLRVGPRFFYVDREYSNMSTTYEKYRTDRTYTALLVQACLEYFSETKASKTSYEDFKKKHVYMTSSEVTSSSCLWSTPEIRDASKFPELFKGGKIKVNKSNSSKLESMYLIMSRDINSFNEFLFTSEMEVHKKSFERYEDFVSWKKVNELSVTHECDFEPAV
ncbi:unnamed protein product [Sphagnum troendelagicum]